MSAVAKAIKLMTIPEKIQLVQEIWDQIATEPEHIPFPDWHRELLCDRERDAVENPENEADWDTVRTRLRAQL